MKRIKYRSGTVVSPNASFAIFNEIILWKMVFYTDNDNVLSKVMINIISKCLIRLKFEYILRDIINIFKKITHIKDVKNIYFAS